MPLALVGALGVIGFEHVLQLSTAGRYSLLVVAATAMYGTSVNIIKSYLSDVRPHHITALAFLFAVFRSRPSPFYVMDEVEAALDDVNLHRFLDLVHEFRQEAQLLIVSHQKRTMEAADCLYGITMQPGGSSRAVSEKTSIG